MNIKELRKDIADLLASEDMIAALREKGVRQEVAQVLQRSVSKTDQQS